jgi:type IV secretory pathway ATPase VirB11/archaellum biosynthesis ATPase
MQTVSEEAAYTLQFINQTQRSVFLTGKAGTGKTTL